MTGPHQRHCLQICLRRALRDSQDMKTLEKEKLMSWLTLRNRLEKQQVFTNRFRVLKITRERLQKDPLSQKVVDTIIHQLLKGFPVPELGRSQCCSVHTSLGATENMFRFCSKHVNCSWQTFYAVLFLSSHSHTQAKVTTKKPEPQLYFYGDSSHRVILFKHHNITTIILPFPTHRIYFHHFFCSSVGRSWDVQHLCPLSPLKCLRFNRRQINVEQFSSPQQLSLVSSSIHICGLPKRTPKYGLSLNFRKKKLKLIHSNSTSLHPPPLHGRGKLLCFQSLR